MLPLVVRAGGGSARDALSMLDQLIAGAGPDGVTYARAVGAAGRHRRRAARRGRATRSRPATAAAVFETVDRVIEAGHDPRRFASDLLERLRDLIVLARGAGRGAKGLLDCPPDQLERMPSRRPGSGTATLSRAADIVHTGLTEMRGTTGAAAAARADRRRGCCCRRRPPTAARCCSGWSGWSAGCR